MSNYKRFITYLFRYENGEKMEQCGYARVEQKQALGKIEFQIKNCGTGRGEILPCFFAKSGQVKVPIGRLAVKGHNAEGSFQFECSHMGGTRYDFSDMCGLVIPLGEEQLIVSQWDDEVYEWKTLLSAAPSGPQSVEEKNEEPEIDFIEEPETDFIEKAETDFVEEPETDFIEKGKTDLPRQSGILQMEEILREDGVLPDEDGRDTKMAQNEMSVLSGQPADSLAGLHSLRPKIYPFEEDKSVWAVQAQLRDMKHLPKEYWKLGNNSFVLRGYIHFGSILIGYMEKEKCFFLGIPGIFQTQEKIIASMFGFEHFRTKKSAQAKPGDFGYWYKVLDVVS